MNQEITNLENLIAGNDLEGAINRMKELNIDTSSFETEILKYLEFEKQSKTDKQLAENWLSMYEAVCQGENSPVERMIKAIYTL